MNNNLLIVTGVHGNEQLPIKVVKKCFPSIKYLVANPKAVQKKVRYIETDLNRSFPGKENGSLEEKCAQKLLPVLKKYDCILDLHTSTCPTPPFTIITKYDQKHVDLALRTGVKRIVLMNKDFASGRALIDHVSLGVSLEAGPDKDVRTEQIIKQALINVLNKKKSESVSFYQIVGILRKTNKYESLTKKLQPFKLVRQGEYITNQKRKVDRDFYPVLPRSKSYQNFLCLMAKRLNLKDVEAKMKGGENYG